MKLSAGIEMQAPGIVSFPEGFICILASVDGNTCDMQYYLTMNHLIRLPMEKKTKISRYCTVRSSWMASVLTLYYVIHIVSRPIFIELPISHLFG